MKYHGLTVLGDEWVHGWAWIQGHEIKAITNDWYIRFCLVSWQLGTEFNGVGPYCLPMPGPDIERKPNGWASVRGITNHTGPGRVA